MKNSSIDTIGTNAHTNGRAKSALGSAAAMRPVTATTYGVICSPVTRKITRRPTTTAWSPKRS
nr:hypothetical protein GCM10017611_59370 [Rhodococcus wratislaviensis]